MEYLKIQFQKIIFWFFKTNIIVKNVIKNIIQHINGVNHAKLIILKIVLQTGSVKINKLIA